MCVRSRHQLGQLAYRVVLCCVVFAKPLYHPDQMPKPDASPAALPAPIAARTARRPFKSFCWTASY